MSTELRTRVQEHAQRRQVSQATVLEHALDLLDREAFFTQLQHDVTEQPEEPSERNDRQAWLGGTVLTESIEE